MVYPKLSVRRCSLCLLSAGILLKAWHEELRNIYDKKVPATNIGRKIYKNCLRFNLPQKQWEEILNSAALNVPKPMQAPERLVFEQYINGAAVVPFELALQIIDAKHIVATTELAKKKEGWMRE